MKYDRLIRNAAEGLMVLEKIEVRMNVKVLSASEHISIDPHSPFFFKMRADMLVNAEFERRVISERSRFGVWRAKSEGRFIGQAPFGYRNERDERDKPIIVIDDERAKIVENIFREYNAGIGFKDLLRKYRAQGLTLKGHSALKRLLTNPVYAGLIEVPDFKEDAARLVRGIHQAIIPEHLFYEVSDKAKGNTQKHSNINDEVFLRGLVCCSKCGSKLTAAPSKGKLKHYWYYLCNTCRHENISANKAHDLIYEIMGQLTFSDHELAYLSDSISKKMEVKLKDKKKQLASIVSQRESTIDKQSNLEEKFIMDLIDKTTYSKWTDKFRREISTLDHKIQFYEREEKQFYDLVNDRLHLLKDLKYVFEKADTISKQKLLIGLFSSKIELSKYFYRTPYVLSIFFDKAININGLDIIKNGNKMLESAPIPVSTRSGT